MHANNTEQVKQILEMPSNGEKEKIIGLLVSPVELMMVRNSNSCNWLDSVGGPTKQYKIAILDYTFW